jgi:hypothetical protein
LGPPRLRSHFSINKAAGRDPLLEKQSEIEAQLKASAAKKARSNCCWPSACAKVTAIRALRPTFTEHGAIMAATILSSPRAVEMSVYVVRVSVDRFTLSIRRRSVIDLPIAPSWDRQLETISLSIGTKIWYAAPDRMRRPWSGDCFHAHTVDVFDAHDRGVFAISHGRLRIDSTAFTTQGGATRRGRHPG